MLIARNAIKNHISFLIQITFIINSISNSLCKHLSKDSFNELVGSEKHLLIKFYAPWCKHCVALEPTWKSFSEVVTADRTSSQIVIARVDCTQESDLCNQEGIHGYPTIKIYNAGDKQGTEYEGPKDLKSLIELLKKLFDVDIEPQSLKTVNEEDKDTVDKVFEKEEPEAEDGEGEAEPEMVIDREKEDIVPENGLFELNDDNFDSFLSTGRHFVKFFAPWCGHCQRLEPTWIRLAARFQNEKSVSISRLDCDQYKDACNKYGIKGYPTLLWIIDGVRIHKYDGARQLDDLETYVRTRVEQDKANSDGVRSEDLIVQVTDRNFKGTINHGITFIQFWAPWCAHCKRLGPIYEALAHKLQREGDKVTIGMMDCSKYDSLCSREGADGYPTLNLYSNGRQISEYEGERSLESMYRFLMKQVDNEMETSFKDEL